MASVCWMLIGPASLCLWLMRYAEVCARALILAFRFTHNAHFSIV